MVCVPCFLIPVILFLFHRFLQPIIYKLWGQYLQEPNLTCPLPAKKKKAINESESTSTEGTTTAVGSDGDSSADAKMKAE